MRTPNGEIFEINMMPAALDSALQLCDGTRSFDEIIEQTGPGFRSILEVLADRPGDSTERAISSPVVVVGVPAALDVWQHQQAIDADQWQPGLDPSFLERTPGGTVVVTVHARRDLDELRRWDSAVSESEVVWVPVVLDYNVAWLGPAVRVGCAPVYQDVLDRRLAASFDLDITEARMAAPVGTPLPETTADLAWLGAVVARQVNRLRANQPCALFGNELELDLDTGALRLHPVLPMPDRAHVPYRNDMVSGPDLLMDKLTGLVAEVEDVPLLPEMPRSLITVAARVGDVRRLGVEWGVNTIAGCSILGGSREHALAATVGESVERYAGNWIQLDRTVTASYRQMSSRPERVLDPSSVALFSDSQYAIPGMPFVPFTHDIEVRWVLGRSVSFDEPVWVPASMAWGNYNLGSTRDEPAVHPTLYAGLAAGPTSEEAIRAGLEEVLERHASMCWWSHQASIPRVRLNDELDRLLRDTDAAPRLEGWLLHVRNRFGLPVIAGVVNDERRQLTTVGFALREDRELCAKKALGEALSNFLWAVDLLNEHGAYWSELREATDIRGRSGKLGYLKPWRADRRYLDSFRADFRDVGDLESQIQLNCDPRARARALPVLAGQGVHDLSSVDNLTDRSLLSYRAIVESQGFEIITVDLTTPDVRLSGLSVVRVLVPGLVNNFAAAFPLWGNDIIAGEAALLGWDSAAGTSGLNTFPMPHA
ncbi:YcaO-like family protein [Nocardia sp. NPDC050435]|uniref:YcaO-like family protein n=1 Tax=Nocardia sp. NPDC050435 TaxID=3155040 RepID=UPI0033D69425